MQLATGMPNMCRKYRGNDRFRPTPGRPRGQFALPKAVIRSAWPFPMLRLRVAISGKSNRDQILGRRNPPVVVSPSGEAGFPIYVCFRE